MPVILNDMHHLMRHHIDILRMLHKPIGIVTHRPRIRRRHPIISRIDYKIYRTKRMRIEPFGFPGIDIEIGVDKPLPRNRAETRRLVDKDHGILSPSYLMPSGLVLSVEKE